MFHNWKISFKMVYDMNEPFAQSMYNSGIIVAVICVQRPIQQLLKNISIYYSTVCVRIRRRALWPSQSVLEAGRHICYYY